MPPKIIDDIPTEQDSFKSHQLIAEAIFLLIRDSSGGKVIGLEGPWGSGKSSVIKILENKISQTRDLVFIYKFDAWTHQGEPLRQTFVDGLFKNILGTRELFSQRIKLLKLEANHDESDSDMQYRLAKMEILKTKCAQAKSLNIAQLTNIKDRFVQKVKTTVTRNAPVIGGLGRTMILLTLLIPLGLVILSSAMNFKPDASNTQDVAWKWVAGIGILCAPFLALLGRLLYVLFDTAGLPPEFRKENINEIWATFQQKSYSEEKNTKIESLDPTTIDYQRQFSEFLSSALTSANSRLVVILDNLDRLPAKEIEAVWPVLRSFVDNSEFSEHDWFKKFWIVLPFAVNINSPDKLDGNSKDSNQAKGLMANPGFFDKVIQVSFSVPYPTTSNLKNYIGKNLKLAFENDGLIRVSEKEIHNIFILFSGELSEVGEVTPRVVISVVNNMVASYLQWNLISLTSHAFFAILRRKYDLESMGDKLVGGKLGIENYLGILPSSVTTELAVLICNLDEKHAAQKLYAPEINGILNSMEGHSQLKDNYKKIGFADAFSTTLNKILVQNSSSPDKLILNISNLMQSDFVESMSGEHREHMKEDVYKALKSMEWFPLHEIRLFYVIQYLATNLSDARHCQGLIEVMKKTCEYFEGDISRWYHSNGKGPDKIVETLTKLRGSSSIKAIFSASPNLIKLSIPGGVDDWIRACGEIEKNGQSSKGFLSKIKSADIIQELTHSRHFNRPVRPLIAAYNSLVDNSVDGTKKIIDSFSARVREIGNAPMEEIVFTIPFLIELYASKGNFAFPLLDSNNIFYYLSELKKVSSDSGGDAENYDVHGPERVFELAGNVIFIWLIIELPRPSKDSAYSDGSAFLGQIMRDKGKYSIMAIQVARWANLRKEWCSNIRSLAKDKKGSFTLAENFLNHLLPLLKY